MSLASACLKTGVGRIGRGKYGHVLVKDSIELHVCIKASQRKIHSHLLLSLDCVVNLAESRYTKIEHCLCGVYCFS